MLEERKTLVINKIPADTILVATINGTDRILTRDQVLRYLGQKKAPKVPTAPKGPKS